MSIPQFEEIVEQNDQTEARREHLDKLRELVGNVYPNKFVRSNISGAEDTISAIKSFKAITDVEAEMAAVKAGLKEGERPPAEIKDAFNERLKTLGSIRIAGRLTTPPRGNFVHLTDGIAKLQIYCNKKEAFALIRNDAENTLDTENGWAAWQLIDHGDFVGVEGYLFVTNTGEVSVHVEKLQFLAKAMLPMPDKMHGIADPEIRQRQRYADLIASSLQVETEGLTTRQVFETRARIISSMRCYLEDHGYVEVETPMLTPKATGAAAKPFETHHNALDIKLYARIAPELYLKRLVVGGFEKVYELNRNFRNEGISYKHNPEFTMLEFYCAYMDVNGMMDFCEQMLLEGVEKATGSRTVNYQNNEIDFSKFQRLSMKNAIALHRDPDLRQLGNDEFDEKWLENPILLRALYVFNDLLAEQQSRRGITPPTDQYRRQVVLEVKDKCWEEAKRLAESVLSKIEPDEFIKERPHLYLPVNQLIACETEAATEAMVISYLFERYTERHIIQPTFIIDYPKSISPLSKASPANPNIAERFELFINGMEVANGFSELNDPKEQYERFKDQMEQREGGDEEAMVLDEDYVRALSYGMPPAAGIGIGIDRLVMLLTNKHSIRDVILFPHLRPEKKQLATEEDQEN